MHAYFLPIALLIAFFTTPVEMVERMLKRTVLDLPRIEVKGRLENDPAVPVIIVYDRQSDEVSLTVGTTVTVTKGDAIAPWMRLFFRKTTVRKPPEEAAALLDHLKKIGIDTGKKRMATTGPEGDLLFIIGEALNNEPLPHLALYRSQLLPFRLARDDDEALFGDYHKSVLPLAFPGRVELRGSGVVTVYSFVRDEYR